MSMCVCFVYLQSYLWNYTSNLHQIFLHVTYGRGLVLLCGLMIHVRYVFPVLRMTLFLL